MNKNVFDITSVKNSDDNLYWKDKTYLQRLEALEQLRRSIFGYDSSTERFQRVFEVTKLK